MAIFFGMVKIDCNVICPGELLEMEWFGEKTMEPLYASVSVKDILDTDVFKGHCVYAGINGLDNTVSRITVTELPDSLDWIVGGELVCTTGYILANEPEKQKTWIRQAAKRGVAAVVIKPERFLGNIPDTIITAANRVNLPIIGITASVRWPSVIQCVMSLIVSHQAQLLSSAFKIHHTLDKIVLSSAGLPSLLDALSAITESTVLLDDQYFNLVSISNRGGLSVDILKTAQEQRISGKMKRYYPQDDSKKQPPVYYLQVMTSGTPLQVMVPVMAANQQFGWLIVFPQNNEMNEFISTAMEHGATAVALELLREFSGISSRTQLALQMLNTLRAGNSIRPQELNYYGQLLRVNLNLPAVIIRMRCYPKLSNSSFFRVEEMLRLADDSILVVPDGDTDIHILYHPAENDEDKMLDECVRLCQDIVEFVKENRYTCYLGISSRALVSDANKFCFSFSEAEECVNEAESSGKTLLVYKKMGIRKILPFFRSKEDAHFFSQQLINNLVEYDKEKKTNLVQTLSCYITSEFNKVQTSKELNIHVNTLNYRLDRIEDILNFDLSDVDTCFLLYLAICILRDAN